MNISCIVPCLNEEKNIPAILKRLKGVFEKEGYSVEVYDPLPYEEYDIERKIVDFKPDIVGFSSMTSSMLLDIIQLGPLIKEKNKDIILVVGGVHATVEPESFLNEPCIDYVIRGEGESAFLEFCDIFDKNKKELKNLKNVNKNELRTSINLNQLENPDFNLIDIRRYVNIWISTSRGCPGDCSFCYSKKMWSINNSPCVRFLNSEKVKEILKDLIENHKITEFLIADDNFTTHKKRCLDICDFLYNEYNGKITFYVQVRTDFVDKEIFDALKKAGCKYVQFGCESGSQKVLDILNKGVTVEKQGESIILARKNKVFNYDSFMLGIPGETIEDLKKTVQFIKKYKPDVVTPFIFHPLPGTFIFENLIKEGKIKKPSSLADWALWNDNWLPVNGIIEKNYSEIPNELLLKTIQELWKYRFYRTKIKRLIWWLKRGKIKRIVKNIKVMVKHRKFSSNY